MNNKLNVVNISSKAVDSQIDGWATYTSAKTYMQKFIEMLTHQEKNNPDFNAINIYPGLIDTDMQEEIRGVANKDFKRQKDFQKYKDDGQLQKPDIVAKKILNQLNY
jgi:benzil reductase ((S)-benzoin forming)